MRFDHLMHWVPDLDQAIKAYGDLGFPVQRGGQHPGLGTQNAVWRSPPAYLELIGVRDRSEASAAMGAHWPRLEALLASGGGAGRFAVHVENVQAVVDMLRSEGIDVSDPRPGSAKREDGTTANWIAAAVQGGPPWAPFFINYGMSPAERTNFLSASERAPQPWQIDRLVVETPDPVSSARWLSRALGTTLEAGATNVPLEGANVEFRVGDSDRVTRVLIGGSNPPSGEVAGLSVDAG